MAFNIRLFAILLCAAISLNPALAEKIKAEERASASLDEPFAIQGGAVLSQAEIDAAFSKIPAEYRLPFIRSSERVNQLLVSLLRSKLVAADAIAAGYDKETLVHNRMALAAEKELAEAWMAHVLENAPEADYEAIAYENYLANPDNYTSEAMVDVSHILVNSEDRSEEEALAQASSIRLQLLEQPDRFDALVEEYSDDPGKASNNGRYAQVKRGQMVKPFEEMAFSMKTPGELSEPVKTSYGYHIIRLNQAFPAGLAPFESVKANAMKQARDQYLSEYRIRYLKQLSSAPIELPDGAVEAMARRHFGDDLELSPDFLE